MKKEKLYEKISEKLERAKNNDLIVEPYAKGFATGALMELIGMYYDNDIITTHEYMELSDAVTKSIDEIVKNKKEGAYNELSNAN